MKRIVLLMTLFLGGLAQYSYTTNPQQPMMSKLYADPFKQGVQQYNNAGELGTLDTQYGQNGSLNMSAQLANSFAKAVRTLADGSVFVLLDNGTDSAVAKYTATGVLETSTFGVSGICSLPGLTNANCMSIDSQGNVLVGGGAISGSSGWLKKITSSGTLDLTFNTNFAAAGTWTYIGAIAQQTSGKYIVVGLNGTGYTQVASYVESGLINNISFGTDFNGYVVFDDLSGRPDSVTGSYALSIDQFDSIYVGYIDTISGYAYLANLNPFGTLVAAFGGSNDGTVHNALGAYAVACDAMHLGLDSSGLNILIAGTLTSTGQIVTYSYTLSTGILTVGFTPITVPTSGSNILQIAGLVTLNKGYLAIISSDTTAQKMRIDQFNSVGTIDAEFNADETAGYVEFSIAIPDGDSLVSSLLYSAAVSQDGQMYLAGGQSVLAESTITITPYLSKIYDYQYVLQVPEYPSTYQQGNFDTTFGTPGLQTFAGVPFIYNGNFGLNLQQQTRLILELPSGNFLVGSDGLTNTSLTQTMMLTWLTSSGLYDTNFGFNSSGKLTLSNASSTNEQMVAIAVGNSGNVYVAGTDGIPQPLLRLYTDYSTTLWTSGSPLSDVNDTGIASVGIALQGTAGVLLFVQDSSNQGHISRYTTTSGTLTLDDSGPTAFGPTGSGKIVSLALGLNMGPVYGGGIVDAAGDIFIAYQNNLTGYIDIAAIHKNGAALITEFATAGIIANVFGSSAIPPSTVRIAFGPDKKIYIAAVNEVENAYLVRCYDGTTGAVDTTFNSGAMLTITPIESPTELLLTNLTGISDGSVMLTGYDAAVDPVMLTLRVTKAGILDTTFNPQGTIPGVVSFQIQDQDATYFARVATGLAIQSHTGGSNGNLIYSAYEQPLDSQSTPEVLSLYGQYGTTQVQRYSSEDQYPGTLDLSLHDCGALDIASITSTGLANVVYSYPDGNAHEGKILIGVDSGSAITIIRVDQASLDYDTTFNPSGITPGLYTISNLTGLKHMTLDSKNRIIICGTGTTERGWARQISENGTGAAVAFMMPPDVNAANMVYQQKSGRYIIVGSLSTAVFGLLVAFQDELVGTHTELAVDETFNPLGTDAVVGRFNIFNAMPLYNLVINSDDTIYVAYKSIADDYLTIAQILANGAGFDLNFCSGSGLLTTTIIPDDDAVVRCVVDASQNVIVAASCASGTTLKAFRCNLTGGTSTEFSGTGVLDGVVTMPAESLGTSGVTLTTLLETEAQQTILIGSNSSGTTTGVDGYLFAVRLTSSGELDTTWNPLVSLPYTQGILTFGAAGVPLTPAITQINNAAINLDGNIFAVGGNGTDPILMKIVGDSYINAVAQGQIASQAGTLDYTLDPSGALNLNTSTGLTLGIMKSFYLYPNGSMLLASCIDGTTIITKLDATLAVDSDFGTSGQVTLDNALTLHDMFVADGTDQAGYIFLTGSNSDAIWGAKVAANGSSVTLLSPTSALQSSYSIRQNLAENIIVAGFDGTNGVVAAYTSNGLGLDPLFGAGNGIYISESIHPIYAMTVDNYSRIYIVYKSSTSAIIQRLLADGSGIDATFAPTEFSYSCNASQLFVQLDSAHNQVVVGSYYSNHLSVHRYSTLDGSSTGDVSDIAIDSGLLNMSDLFIDSDQNIYVVAYNVSGSPDPGYQTVIARIASINSTTIALDQTYGVDGIASIAIPELTGNLFSIASGALDPDGRVYVVGTSPNSIPYMARFFGDNYYTQVSQALNAAQPGDFDYTYSYDGIAINYADGASTPTSNQQIRAIRQLPQGTQIMTVVTDGVHSWTLRLLSNGANDSTYNSGQGIVIDQLSCAEVVQGMVYDGVGNSIVFGSNDLHGGFVKSILPLGGMNTTFGGYTGALSTVAYPTGTAYIPALDIVHAVAQMSDGSFVFVGSKEGVGMIGMLSLTGNVIPFGSDSVSFVTSGADITSVSVDSDDNIYVSVGYLTSGSLKNVRVMKLTASGLLVSSFGASGIVNDVLVDTYGYANNRLVFNSLGKIIVAASGNSSQPTIDVIQLLADGSVDTSFHNGQPCSIEFAEGSTAIITSLIVLDDNKILISGYQDGGDTITNNDYEFVACVTPDGILDDTFNQNGTTPGLLTFQVADSTQQARYLWDMNIQVDGKILLAGSETPETIESTPLTMRLDGYINTKAVAQFTGYQPINQATLNPAFGEYGIAISSPISELIDGGDVVVDSQGRVIVGGRTYGSTFIMTRFLSTGQLDQTFGNDGIAQSGVITGTIDSSYLALTGDDDIIIGGLLTNESLTDVVCTKFSGSNGSQVTTGFGTSGIVKTTSGISNLTAGGFITVDSNGRILIGGYTSNFTLVVVRFLPDGSLDTAGFNAAGVDQPAGVATTGPLAYLAHGGYVVTDSSNNVYLGGSTSAGTLVVVKFLSAGTVESGFGTSGIAATGQINNFVTGGSLALDRQENIVIGGYTSNQTFVVAKFLPSGFYDTSFSSDGVTFSNPTGMTIDGYGDLAIDSNNAIIIGGTALVSSTLTMTIESESDTMFAARWLSDGTIDTTFSTTGIAYTGVINQLYAGGFVGSDVFDQVFVAGVRLYTSRSLMNPPDGSFVVAEFYSGEEIFVTNPATLSPQDFKIYYYGNNPLLFQKYLGVDLFARCIPDLTAQQATVTAVQNIFDRYAVIYENQPGWNLVLHTYREYDNLIAAQLSLGVLYTDFENDINKFFDLLYNRIGILTGHYVLT